MVVVDKGVVLLAVVGVPILNNRSVSGEGVE